MLHPTNCADCNADLRRASARQAILDLARPLNEVTDPIPQGFTGLIYGVFSAFGHMSRYGD
jgi:hypothetical protein